MITIATWLWGEKYSPEYVYRLANGVRRNLKQQHRFVVVTSWRGSILQDMDDTIQIDGPDYVFLDQPGCFARLQMFNPLWQARNKIADRLVCLDLDVVITGPLDPLFDRPEPFVILQGANAANPCPYNGSVMMLRAGAHPEVWRDFVFPVPPEVPRYSFPDDQGWLWHKVPNAAGWQCGSKSGIYAFAKPGWPHGTDLPTDACIVAFPGSRDPRMYTALPWVQQHWR